MARRNNEVREAKIHFELYHHLQNVIGGRPSFRGIQFTRVEPELRIDGKPDIVIFDKTDKPWLVIEAKRRTRTGYTHNFDPYSPLVIKQAFDYASDLGSPYFATYNGQVLVLFETFKEFVPLPQRRQKHYNVIGVDLDVFVKQLLEDVVGLRQKVKKWQPFDDAFISRLQTFHNFTTPFILASLKEMLKKPSFKASYEDWIKEQGFEYEDKTHLNFAKQSTYLLMNKILFYKILETKYDLPVLSEVKSLNELPRKLRGCFESALNIDYRAVFQRDPIFDEIPLTKNLAQILNEFIEEVSEYNIAEIRSDVIGRIYEKLIPKDERHRLGQYYTPPQIVDLIVKMCVNDPNDTILDPGCGSGGFLIKAYHRLLELKGKKLDSKVHQEILNRLWGVDINRFPAHLATINLAMQDIESESDYVNVLVSDFFDILPKQQFITPWFGVTPEGEKEIIRIPPQFDAVVANPPYTRQEEILAKHKEKIRKVALMEEGVGKRKIKKRKVKRRTKEVEGEKIKLSARAGIYAYFFTHGARFLKNGKRMGMITSNSWLSVDFGEDLQRFFLDRFRILAIIGFDKDVFEDANVETCVTILEKAKGKKLKERRDENLVKFVRIKKKMGIDKIVKTVDNKDLDYADEKLRIIVKKQKDLYGERKWGKYIYAPPLYFGVIKHPEITTLDDIAKVKYGIKTGANPFFILDKEKAKEWGINDKYLKLAITSPREAAYIDLMKKDIHNYVFMVHKNKRDLKDEGCDNVLSYIKDGERRGYSTNKSVQDRILWYDLGDRMSAPILFPKDMRERVFAIWNRANALSTDRMYEIYPNQEENITVLVAILNSSLLSLFTELHGRWPGRGLLDIMVYEVEGLPILDPRRLTKMERKEIENAFLDLVKAQRKEDKSAEKAARERLDIAILKPLGFEDKLSELYTAVEELKRMRQERKRVGLLVEDVEAEKARAFDLASLDEWE